MSAKKTIFCLVTAVSDFAVLALQSNFGLIRAMLDT